MRLRLPQLFEIMALTSTMAVACADDAPTPGRPAHEASRDAGSQDADATAGGLDYAARERRDGVLAQSDAFPDALPAAERQRLVSPAVNVVDGEFVGRIIATFPDLSVTDARQYWLQLHDVSFDGVVGDVWVIACVRDCVSYMTWQPAVPTVVGKGALAPSQWIKARGSIRDGLYLLPAATIEKSAPPGVAQALTLRLVDAAKAPVAGVDVKVTYDAANATTYRTAADGTFVIEPGACRLTIDDARFKPLDVACPTGSGDVAVEQAQP
jgi:hypothetical protein